MLLGTGEQEVVPASKAGGIEPRAVPRHSDGATDRYEWPHGSEAVGGRAEGAMAVRWRWP